MSVVKCSAILDATSPGTTSPTITVPTGGTAPVAGDIGIVMLGAPSPTLRVITPPAGWSVVSASAVYNNMCVAIYQRIYQAGDPSTVAFASTVADLWAMAGVWLDGTVVQSLDVIGTVGSRGGSSTLTTAPALTASAAGEIILAIFGERSTAITTATVSVGTQDFYQEYIASTCSFLISEQTAGSTAVAAVTATYTGASGNGMGLQVALTPVPTTPPAVQTWVPTTDTGATITGWTKVPGGAASIAAVLADNDPTTYAESGSNPAGLVYQSPPFSLIVPMDLSTVAINVSGYFSSGTTGSRVVALYQGTTLVHTSTVTLGSSNATAVVAPSVPEASAMIVTAGLWQGLSVKITDTAS